MDAKDDAIQDLKQEIEQQTEDTKQEKEKVEELEEYVRIQEEHYAQNMAKLVLENSEMHTEHEQHKA
mgnify:CR=1 FL=1